CRAHFQDASRRLQFSLRAAAESRLHRAWRHLAVQSRRGAQRRDYLPRGRAPGDPSRAAPDRAGRGDLHPVPPAALVYARGLRQFAWKPRPRAGRRGRVAHERISMDKELIEELMVFVGLMALLGSLTKIVLTMVNRRKAVAKESGHGSLDDIAQRLGRIEQAVYATAVEVERISEAQRFTTKLLVDKGHQVPVESPRKVVTPH